MGAATPFPPEAPLSSDDPADLTSWRSEATPGGAAARRVIGDFIRQARSLTDDQVDQILALQRQLRMRFGDAAVALKLASEEDVVWALSQQHAYPYSVEGEVSLAPELVVATDPFSSQAEYFRDLRSRLLAGVCGGKTLAVVSAGVGEGKTYFAANMAISLSQLGARTLLIDADLRTPRLHDLFRLPNDTGLSHILSQRQSANALYRVPSLPSLYVMPSGILPPNPLDLVQRQAFDKLLQQLSTKFDHVIVDTPAAAYGADSRVTAAKTGAAVVIAQRHESSLGPLKSLLDDFASAQLPVAGVLINEFRKAVKPRWGWKR